MENYTLIINGHEITSQFEDVEEKLNTKFGKPTNIYNLHIEVEKDSEADLELKKLIRGQNESI